MRKIVCSTLLAISSPLLADLSFIGKEGKVTEEIKKSEYSVLQFWASWCVGCGDNMDSLTTLQKTNPDLGFFPISIDDDVATAKKYFKDRLMPETTAFDTEMEFATEKKIKSIPALVVVDKSGKEVWRFEGHIGPKEVEEIVSKTKLSKEGK